MFLKKVESQVCAQLDRNLKSRAFEDYQVEWEEPVAMVSCIHRLSDRIMMEQEASQLLVHRLCIMRLTQCH